MCFEKSQIVKAKGHSTDIGADIYNAANKTIMNKLFQRIWELFYQFKTMTHDLVHYSHYVSKKVRPT